MNFCQNQKIYLPIGINPILQYIYAKIRYKEVIYLNVLAVDDETKITDVISEYLTFKNMRVFTAETAAKALDIFDKEQIDFIILDLMLLDIEGETLCRMIRKKSDVPMIMLTAKSRESDMLDGLNTGADDYIRKPFSLKELKCFSLY
ncbi:MAG: response regulator [Firmicutes bacterium]|nr:response regulator [Bacillota bacterium]